MSSLSFSRSHLADRWGLPAHWQAFSLGRVATSMCDGPFGSDMKSSHYEESGVRLIRLQNIRAGAFDDGDRAYISQSHFESLPGHDARPGDLLIAGLGDANNPLGRACVLPESVPIAMVKADCFRVRLDERRVRHRFVAHFLASEVARIQTEGESRGVTRSRINLGVASRIVVPVPPVSEQQIITAFLDRRTAMLDALIEKKTRLIERLREKRQALVTEAVTRGLDPSAPMKKSGIEWLPQIPSHWAMTRVKRTARNEYRAFVDGDWIEAPFITEHGIRLVQTGNVGVGVYREQGFRYISERTFHDLGCAEVFPGDVLICRLDGPVGRACLAPDLGHRMITSVDNVILRPNSSHDARYIKHVLSSDAWLDMMKALCRVGGGHRFRISRTMLGDQAIPSPPVEEQRRIADHLDAATARLDRAADALTTQIARLREYRQALITEAVTGKIPPARMTAA